MTRYAVRVHYHGAYAEHSRYAEAEDAATVARWLVRLGQDARVTWEVER